jgi:hypothetical protein
MVNLISIDSDKSVWEERAWKIATPSVISPLVEAPSVKINLKSSEPIGTLTGGFSFILETKRKYIDEFAHQSLLEKSMREYEGIWRKLAEK